MKKTLISLMVVMLVVPVAWTGSLADVAMDDQVTVSESILHLNGMGLRKKLWIKVYVAGLYLEEATHDAAAAVNAAGKKRIVMHFLTKKATKKKMDAAWVEGFEANSPTEYKTLEARVKTFMDYFGDMKVGDVIECTILPGEGTQVTLNGDDKGIIEGDDFGAALIRVWLGPKPPTEELQKGLLGVV